MANLASPRLRWRLQGFFDFAVIFALGREDARFAQNDKTLGTISDSEMRALGRTGNAKPAG
jgi:hypothetical protein